MKIKRCKRGFFEGAFLVYIDTSPCRCESGICRYGGDCDATDGEFTLLAVHDAQQAAIAAAIEILDSLEEISTESWAGIAAGCWIDMSEIRKALAQLRAVKEEADDA